MQIQRHTITKVVTVVFVFNLVLMGTGTWFAYQESPPIPEKVVGPGGDVIATDEQIRTFQRNRLMNHGSILRNGAYYGTDYTANTLQLKLQYMGDYYAGERYSGSYDPLSSERQAAIADLVRQDLGQGYDGGAIQYSADELCAH